MYGIRWEGNWVLGVEKGIRFRQAYRLGDLVPSPAREEQRPTCTVPTDDVG